MGNVSMLRSAMCRIVGHWIDQRRVWDDGLNFRTTCRLCRRPLLKDMHGWRLFASQTDSSVQRKPHPRSRVPQ